MRISRGTGALNQHTLFAFSHSTMTTPTEQKVTRENASGSSDGVHPSQQQQWQQQQQQQQQQQPRLLGSVCLIGHP